MKTLARERDKARILQRLMQLRPETSGRWGRMSVHQMICHLSDSFLMMTGEKPVSQATSLLRRTALKCLVLYVPVRWPRGIVTRPEIEQGVGGTNPEDFAADLARLEALLNRATQVKQLHAEQHPLFGPMSRAAWLRWAYLHVDHHLRQFGA